MKQNPDLPVIVVADDNAADRLLTVKALKNAFLHNPIQEVQDGEELMDFLLGRGDHAERAELTRPMLILLDINMPRKNGLEALAEIKAHDGLRRIPVIILTTSSWERDVVRSYDLGVNSFVTKPVDFMEFLETVQKLGEYWLDVVTLASPVQ